MYNPLLIGPIIGLISIALSYAESKYYSKIKTKKDYIVLFITMSSLSGLLTYLYNSYYENDGDDEGDSKGAGNEEEGEGEIKMKKVEGEVVGNGEERSEVRKEKSSKKKKRTYITKGGRKTKLSDTVINPEEQSWDNISGQNVDKIIESWTKKDSEENHNSVDNVDTGVPDF